MAMDPKELRGAIEAILFAADEPVSLDELAEAFAGDGRDAVSAQLEAIRKAFEEAGGGFCLEQAGGGWRFATRAEHDPVLRRFFSRKREGRLSIAALETLAMIAYRQPITAPEISDIRGVNSTAVIRTLLERKMIRVAGRKNVVGSPFLYRTTREFLVHFGLNDIQDLPRLEEFADLIGENITDDLAALPVQASMFDAPLAPTGGAQQSAEHGQDAAGWPAARQTSASSGGEAADDETIDRELRAQGVTGIVDEEDMDSGDANAGDRAMPGGANAPAAADRAEEVCEGEEGTVESGGAPETHE